ncbi:MAG TPA: hypothetical protein EYN51_11415 [Flavobacteriales bacterium]|nr:hypothetical protein [Flavobacteriales bacterium]
MQFRLLSILLTLCLFFGKAAGQGCSDPGICTSGSLNAANTQDSTSRIDFTEASFDELLNATVASEKYRIGADFVYGIGDNRTAIYNLVLRFSIRVKERMLVNIKMPFAYISGNIGTTAGTGDLTLTIQNTFNSGKNINMAYTLGVIIPTNTANLKYKNEVMPMAYQSSLGLFSALGGLSFRYKQWAAVIGYQYSFGSNSNGFLSETVILDSNAENFSDQQKRASYFSSQKLTRGSDLILRLERGFQIKKLSIAIGVLPILRLSNSSIVDSSGTTVTVLNSDGLTFNITAGLSYQLNNSTYIRLNYGSPVLSRKVRPDGLTRSSVIILGVGVKLW